MSFQLNIDGFEIPADEESRVRIDLMRLQSRFPQDSTIYCNLKKKGDGFEAHCQVFSGADEFGTHTIASDLKGLCYNIHRNFEEELEKWRKDRFTRETFEVPKVHHWIDDDN